jgi:hypothetical protein
MMPSVFLTFADYDAAKPLCGSTDPLVVQNRAHFFAIASHLMRQILVDYARRRRMAKRGGGCRLTLEEALLV